jgi:hypothetical protein
MGARVPGSGPAVSLVGILILVLIVLVIIAVIHRL